MTNQLDAIIALANELTETRDRLAERNEELMEGGALGKEWRELRTLRAANAFERGKLSAALETLVTALAND